MGQRVVCAALKNEHGDVILGARHFDWRMRRQIEERSDTDTWKNAEQGFIDQYGGFLTRAEAHVHAHRAGQVIRRVGGDVDTLYSENLY